MDPTLGLILVVAFPIVLCLAIAAFGYFTVDPE